MSNPLPSPLPPFLCVLQVPFCAHLLAGADVVRDVGPGPRWRALLRQVRRLRQGKGTTIALG